MRRLSRSGFLLVLFLAAASPAAAGAFSTWSFGVSESGELAADFGLEPFRISAPLNDWDWMWSDEFQLSSGTFTLVSGPLISVSTDGDQTHYSYGPGTVTIALSGYDQHDTFAEGTITAPVRPFSFIVCEGCDTLFGGGRVYDGPEIDFGPGLVDAEFARPLGLKPTVVVSFSGLGVGGLEAIDGNPGSVRRSGFSPLGFAELEITVEVPEPAALVLGALSVLGVALRRRASRRV